MKIGIFTEYKKLDIAKEEGENIHYEGKPVEVTPMPRPNSPKQRSINNKYAINFTIKLGVNGHSQRSYFDL